MFWLKWSEQSSPDPGKGVGRGEKIHFNLSNILLHYVFFNFIVSFLRGGLTSVTTRTHAHLPGTHLQLLYRYPSSHILFLLYFHFNLINILLCIMFSIISLFHS